MSTTSRQPDEVAHFRNIKVIGKLSERSLVDIQPAESSLNGTNNNGPAFCIHDYLAPGQVLKVVSTRFPEQIKEGTCKEVSGVTGTKVRAAEVKDIAFPMLVEPIDDLPPATMITSPPMGTRLKLTDGTLFVRGTTTDNGKVVRVLVNGVEAHSTNHHFHSWEVKLTGLKPGPLTITAHAEDDAGNVEKQPHRLSIVVE